MASNFAEINWKRLRLQFSVYYYYYDAIILFDSYRYCMWVYILSTYNAHFKRHKEVHPIMYVLMALFILYFVFVHK